MLAESVLSTQNAVSRRCVRQLHLDEVDDALVARHHHVVEATRGAFHVVDVARQQMGDQVGGQFDQGNAGGFQRFDEAAGQAHRHAIPAPVLRPVTGLKLDVQCLQAGRSVAHVTADHFLRAGGVGVPRRIDVADAAPLLQADVPDPSGFLRGGAGERQDRRVWARIRHLQRHRAIGEQHVAPAVERRLHRAADQGAAQAGAVHVEVGAQLTDFLRDDARDRA